jgi:hypothetical protein
LFAPDPSISIDFAAWALLPAFETDEIIHQLGDFTGNRLQQAI